MNEAKELLMKLRACPGTSKAEIQVKPGIVLSFKIAEQDRLAHRFYRISISANPSHNQNKNFQNFCDHLKNAFETVTGKLATIEMEPTFFRADIRSKEPFQTKEKSNYFSLQIHPDYQAELKMLQFNKNTKNTDDVDFIVTDDKMLAFFYELSASFSAW